jgi:predicted AAA+ superfamily ATPase
MNTSEIIETLNKWNFWNQKIDTGFKRVSYVKKIERYLEMPEIVAITGVRRSGKSTIVLQIIENLLKDGVPPENTLYINFEEPGLEDVLNARFLTKIFDAHIEFYDPKGRVYLFLDEIQLVSGWEKFAASLYDRRANVKIFVTGSSSKLLKGEVATLLSGRYVSEVVYPLSFREFLDFKHVKYTPLIKTPALYHKLREYVEFGGFPRVVTEREEYAKKVVLTEYFNSIVERDIVLRHKVKNIRDVREIANFSFTNVSGQISSYRIEKDFDISSQNARRYLEYFNEAFLLQFAPFFSYSVKKQTYNPQKVFAIDTGLRNAVSFKFSEDSGKLLENIVFLELLRKKQFPYYWKDDKTEVDFLLRDGLKPSCLINVCYSLNTGSMAREISSLEKGLETFAGTEALLVYWEGKPMKHPKIQFINILDYLLHE